MSVSGVFAVLFSTKLKLFPEAADAILENIENVFR